MFRAALCLALVAIATAAPAEDGRMCCMAMSADCLACSKGVTVDEYCQTSPETQGCEEHLGQPGGGGRPTRKPHTRPAPVTGPTLWDLMTKDKDLTTFCAAVKAAGYDKLLASTSPWTKLTIFAPTNAAFAKIPKDTLAKLLQPAQLKDLQGILGEHVVFGGRSVGVIFSSDLKDDAAYPTMARQSIVAHGSAKAGWVMSNSDYTAKAHVVKADLKAANGVYHEIDAVLMPIKSGTPGDPCTKEIGPCPKADQCRIPASSFPSNCKPETSLHWGRGATCCINPCVYRDATGAQCRPAPRTRPTPASRPPTTIPGPQDLPCPATCSATMKACITKGYSTANCLQYASKGYLCKGADGKGLACDGTKLLPSGNQPQCADVQTYNACGGCQPTCENTNPRCTKMCHAGCFCPRATPVFDNALGKCVTFDKCPSEDSCENQIKTDYLDSGNSAAKCAGTDAGSTCKTTCDASACVPRKNFPFADKLQAFCSKYTQDTCGKKTPTDPRASYCEWAGATPTGASGPTFVCSVTDDGAAAWTIQDEGECSAGGGVDDSVCDYIEQTDCLDKGKCDPDTQKQCYGLVKTTYSACTMQCFASSHKDKVCGDCLINSMFKTRTIKATQPDIFSCCGCLDEVFAKVNLDKAELAELLAAPCKKHSPTGDDDDDDGDDK